MQARSEDHPGQKLQALRRLASWVADHELWPLALAAPVLVFPVQRLLPVTYLALLVLAGLWPCRKWARGAWTVRTPLDGPLLVLAALIPVGYAVSTVPDLALGKACGLALGIAAYYGLVNYHPLAESRKAFRLACWGLLLAGLAVALVGLLGTDWWADGKFARLSRLYQMLPRVFRDVPNSVRGGFHPNEVAGTLILFLPLSFSLWLVTRGWRRWVPVLASTVIAAVLFLTQSRGAWLAVAVAGLWFVLVYWPRVRALILGGTAIASIVAIVLLIHQIQRSDLPVSPDPDRSNLAMALLKADTASRPVAGYESVGWVVRLEIWQNAVQALADYPLTGVGLAAFPRIAQTYYIWEDAGPIFLRTMGHAHNLYLQVGLDFGLPGLLAFLALLGSFFWAARRALNTENQVQRTLVLGLLTGVVAYLLHGLVDAVTLGAKPGLVLWVIFGLVITAALTERAWPAGTPGRSFPGISRPFPIVVGITALLALTLFWPWPGQSPLDGVQHNWTLVRLDQALLRPGLDNSARTALLPALLPELEAMASQPGAAPSIWRRVGIVDWLLNQPASAVAALGHDPESSTFLLNQAVLQSFTHIRAGSTTEMFDLAGQLQDQVATDYCRLAGRLQAEGDLPESEWVYRQAIDRGGSQDPDTRAKCYAGLARTFIEVGDWDQAAQSYVSAAHLVPGSFEYQLNAGWSLYRAGKDYDQAAQFLQQAARLDPSGFWSCVMLSEVYRQQGRLSEALEWASQAVARAPDQAIPLVSQARTYLASGDTNQSIAILHRALQMDASNGQVHYWLGEALWSQGDQAGAIAEFQQAIDLTVGSAGYYIRLGDAYRDMGREDQAIAEYRAALRVDPSQPQAQVQLERLLQSTPPHNP